MNCVAVPRRGLLLALLILFLTNGLLSDTLEDLASRGAAAMQRGDYATAEREYRAATVLAPGMAQILSNLGLALTLQEKFQEAEKPFRAALKADPSLFVPNYFLGKQLFKTNRYAEAKPLLLAALAQKPEDSEVRRWVAVTYLGLRDYRRAIEEYRTILKVDPHDNEALYAVGKTYTSLMEESLRKISADSDNLHRNLLLLEAVELGPSWRSVAKSELPRLIREHPTFPRLHRELGNLELEDGNWLVAEALFRQELALDVLDYRARFALGQALLVQKQIVAANEEFERAIHIRPQFFCPQPKLLIKLDHSTMEFSVLPESVRWVSRIANTNAKDQDAFCEELGTLRKELDADPKLESKSTAELFREKRFEQVIRRFESSTRSGSKVDIPRILVAQAYFETGEYEAAAKTIETITRKEEIGDPEHYLLCRSYQKLALQSLEAMERYSPDSYRAHQLLGETLLAKQNPREALQAFKLALDRKPQDPEMLYLLGRCHYLLGELPEAFNLLQQAIQADPYNAEATYLMGEGLVYTQEGAKAIPYLTRTLQLNPSMLRAHAELGKAYLQMSQFKLAVVELETAAALDKNGDLHYLLYRAYSRLNRKELAAKAVNISTRLRSEKIARERRAVESRN